LQSSAKVRGRLHFRRSVVQEIVAEGLQFALDAVVLLRLKLKIAKHLYMDMEKVFGIAARVGAASGFKGASNRQQAIGHALHGGDDHHDLSIEDRFADEIRGMQHAFSSQQRATAKFERENVPRGLARLRVENRP
jgi:hypothetical protein